MNSGFQKIKYVGGGRGEQWGKRDRQNVEEVNTKHSTDSPVAHPRKKQAEFEGEFHKHKLIHSWGILVLGGFVANYQGI